MAAECSKQGRMEMQTPFGPQEGAARKKIGALKGTKGAQQKVATWLATAESLLGPPLPNQKPLRFPD
jgi:hypothetical protein